MKGNKGMKAVILAGGFGTRISEKSQFKPKPMVEIGMHPILWHINERLICIWCERIYYLCRIQTTCNQRMAC